MTITDEDYAMWVMAGYPCVHCGSPRGPMMEVHCSRCFSRFASGGVSCQDRRVCSKWFDYKRLKGIKS